MQPRVVSTRLVHHVAFYFDRPTAEHGSQVQQVKTRSLRTLEIPNSAFAFAFYDILEVTVAIGRRTVVLRERLNESREYHYGRAMSLKTALRKYGRQVQDLQKYKQRGYTRVLQSLLNHWYPLEKNDVVIDPSQRSKT